MDFSPSSVTVFQSNKAAMILESPSKLFRTTQVFFSLESVQPELRNDPIIESTPAKTM